MSVDTAIRAVHLICAAIWAGGLVFLAIAVGAARKAVTDDRERVELFRALGRRFLVVGGVALLLLVATGSDMAADRLQSWGDLLDTAYGRHLSEKLVLVATVIGLMAIHTQIQGPALSRLRLEALERPDDAELAARIRAKSVRSGMVNMAMLLATLAILVLAAKLVQP